MRFALHADLTSFTGRDLVRIVEPGEVELWVGASSADIRAVCRSSWSGRAGRSAPSESSSRTSWSPGA